MKLSMSNIAWAPEERLEAYAAMADAGFTGLEIAPGLFFHACDDPFEPSEQKTSEALAEIADHGLRFVSMQSLLFGVQGAGLFDGDKARRALVEGMHSAIDLAGRFGIPNLVFGSPLQRKVPAGMAMEQAFDEAVEVFRALGDRAQNAGTCITVEANPAAYGTNFLTSFEQAVGFVESVDHLAVAAILDLGAMHMNGSFDTVPDHLKTLNARLNHVHVSEPDLAPAPAEPDGLVPVFASLSELGYSMAVSIEMRRPDNGIEGVKNSIASLARAAKSSGITGDFVHA